MAASDRAFLFLFTCALTPLSHYSLTVDREMHVEGLVRRCGDLAPVGSAVALLGVL